MVSRAIAHLCAGALDARLASGELPEGDPALAARAAMLLRPRAQRNTAACLRRAIGRAGQSAGLSAATPVSASARDSAGEALAQLARRLRAGDATDPQGVALARRLLTDPDSALYRDHDGDLLWQAARAALLALGRTDDATRHAPAGQVVWLA